MKPEGERSLRQREEEVDKYRKSKGPRGHENSTIPKTLQHVV